MKSTVAVVVFAVVIALTALFVSGCAVECYGELR